MQKFWFCHDKTLHVFSLVAKVKESPNACLFVDKLTQTLFSVFPFE